MRLIQTYTTKLTSTAMCLLWVEGPLVSQLQETFAEDWSFTTGEPLDGELWFPPLEPAGALVARGIPDGPDGDFDKLQLAINGAIAVARRSVCIVTPYFLPEEALVSALNLAAMRGVDVRIMVPDQVDHLIVWLAAFSYFEEMVDEGIRFFRYTGGFLHQKVMLVDDRSAAIGTANMDNRSFRLNFEVTALISDEAFAGEMEAMFLADFEHSAEITPEHFEDASLFWRLGVNLSRLAAPVL